MTAKLPSLDALLELNPAEFSAAVAHLSEAEKATLRKQLSDHLAALESDEWTLDRRMRGHHSKFTGAKHTYERLNKSQDWLAARFHEAFATIYADSSAAAAKCWAYEQQHGTAQTAQVLKTGPALFGELKGWTVLGVHSTTRKEALKHAKEFDFAAYRYLLNMASANGRKLYDALKEVAHVATA